MGGVSEGWGGVLGKVTYFYKESKSNIKERKKLGLGVGEIVGGGGWSL